MAERRKRITASDVHQHSRLLKLLPIEIDHAALDESWSATMLLARNYELTSYDAAYLEISVRRGVALGSLDKELRTAANAEKVPLLPEKL